MSISEEEQRRLFIQYYKKEKTQIYCEVPVFCRSVDLVKYNRKEQTINAVEFKTSNWKRAIEQVLSVSISFDYLEICIFTPKTIKSKNIIIQSCNNMGLGLYFFNQEDNSFDYPLKPKRVRKIWEIQKMHILEYVKGAKLVEF